MPYRKSRWRSDVCFAFDSVCIRGRNHLFASSSFSAIRINSMNSFVSVRPSFRTLNISSPNARCEFLSTTKRVLNSSRAKDTSVPTISETRERSSTCANHAANLVAGVISIHLSRIQTGIDVSGTVARQFLANSARHQKLRHGTQSNENGTHNLAQAKWLVENQSA